MGIFRTVKLIWTFYKSYLLASLLITIACINLFWKYGFDIFSELFWFKIISLGIIYYFINYSKRKEYYYYQNLGISKVVLWTVTLLFDFSFFIFLIIQTYCLR